MATLTEYSSTSVALANDDLNYLLSFVRSEKGDEEADHSKDASLLESITPTPEPGVFSLRPGPFVGRLGLASGKWLDFQSRFDFEDVIELIRVSGRRPIKRDTLTTEAAAGHFIIDAIALAFAREVERLAGGGLAKGYRSELFLRPPYPGRIDVSYHLGRLAARPDLLATRARRLTHDIPINRALALALDVLTRAPLSHNASVRLARLAPVFLRIRRQPMHADEISRLPLSNLTVRYREALALAEIVLRSQSLVPQGSGLSGASILFHMPKVWESFVLQWVRGRWPDTFKVEGQYSFGLTDDGQRTSAADVVVRDEAKVVGLYDAKYKWPTKAPTTADVYQMVTYCHRLAVDEATLVYPVETPSRTLVVKGKSIHVVGLRPFADRLNVEREPKVALATV